MWLLNTVAAPPPPGTFLSRPVAEAEASAYVGDRVCAACHPREFAAHRRSHHAHTLKLMRRDQLPAGFPTDAHFEDAERHLAYALTERDGRFYFSVVLPTGVRSRPVDYAFGSGKTGMTLVGRWGEEAIIEFRMSYFPHQRRWM
ncbi:MAG: hypothetical protein RMK49_09055, partial [Abditibacteriales bacterium]|nr:hypothetical protein [Abditibacteriales bacterium]